MPHYLRFVRALALGSVIASSVACSDDDDEFVDADGPIDSSDIDANEDPDADDADADPDAPIADAAVDANIDAPWTIVDGPLPPPDLAA